MTTITFETTHVCILPVSRHEMGFPSESDRGNVVLLLAEDLPARSRAAYAEGQGICGKAC
jgi:hypothetical protein